MKSSGLVSVPLSKGEGRSTELYTICVWEISYTRSLPLLHPSAPLPPTPIINRGPLIVLAFYKTSQHYSPGPDMAP